MHKIISDITTNMTHIHIYSMETKTDGLLRLQTHNLSGTILAAVETLRHEGTYCGIVSDYYCFSTDGHIAAQRLK